MTISSNGLTAATLQHIMRYKNSNGDIDIDGISNLETIIANLRNSNKQVIYKDLALSLSKDIESYMKQIFSLDFTR